MFWTLTVAALAQTEPPVPAGLNAQAIRALDALVNQAGPLGPLALLICFGLAPLLSLPGMALVGVCIAAYGPVGGGTLSLMGTALFVTTPWWMAKRVGPRGPGRWLRWGLQHVQRHPVLTVALVRLLVQLSTPASLALALSGVRYRDYLLGSMLGMLPPVAAMIGLFGGA